MREALQNYVNSDKGIVELPGSELMFLKRVR